MAINYRRIEMPHKKESNFTFPTRLAVAGTLLGVVAYVATRDPQEIQMTIKDFFGLNSTAVDLPDCKTEFTKTFKADNGNTYTVTCDKPEIENVPAPGH
jgi:hypothetical protein